MRHHPSVYSTLNPNDKWNTLPQHQNIHVNRKRLLNKHLQQQQQTSNLALNGANVFRHTDYVTEKMKAQAATRKRQYQSNRSYLQFAGKAKIHVPKVQNRLDYSLPSNKTNVNQFMRNNNNKITANYKHRNNHGNGLNFSSTIHNQKKPNNFYSKNNTNRSYINANINNNNNRNIVWSKNRLQSGRSIQQQNTNNHTSYIHMNNSRQTFGSFGSPSLMHKTLNGSSNYALPRNNSNAKHINSRHVLSSSSSSSSSSIANNNSNKNIVKNQEAAMQKLIMQQQQYEKEQKELQHKQFLLLKQKQQQQQQLNSTYPIRSNSSSNINNSSNSGGKIPVVPRKSITPPCLKQQHSTTIINGETQSSYSNMKFPSSAPSSSNGIETNMVNRDNNNNNNDNSNSNVTNSKPKLSIQGFLNNNNMTNFVNVPSKHIPIAKSNNNDKRANDTIHTSSEVTSSCDTEDFHAAVLRDLNKFTESKIPTLPIPSSSSSESESEKDVDSNSTTSTSKNNSSRDSNEDSSNDDGNSSCSNGEKDDYDEGDIEGSPMEFVVTGVIKKKVKKKKRKKVKRMAKKRVKALKVKKKKTVVENKKGRQQSNLLNISSTCAIPPNPPASKSSSLLLKKTTITDMSKNNERISNEINEAMKKKRNIKARTNVVAKQVKAANYMSSYIDQVDESYYEEKLKGKKESKKLDTGLNQLKEKGFEIKFFKKQELPTEEEIYEKKIKNKPKRRSLDTGLEKLKEDGYRIIKAKSSSTDDENGLSTPRTPRKEYDADKEKVKAQKRVNEMKRKQAKESAQVSPNSQNRKAQEYARNLATKQKELRRARIYAVNCIQREWKIALMKAFDYNMRNSGGLDDDDEEEEEDDELNVSSSSIIIVKDEKVEEEQDVVEKVVEVETDVVEEKQKMFLVEE